MAVTPIANTSAQLTGDTVLTDPADLASQVTGLLPNANLTDSGVVAATYGDATHVAQVTVNAKGLVTAAADVLISGGSGTVTNTGTLTDHALIVGNSGVDVSALASLGTATTVLHGNAAGDPTFGAVALTTDVSGTLPVANGGTGQTTYTDGQLLIGNTTGNTLAKATLTAGTNVTITNGSGAITIAAGGSSSPWPSLVAPPAAGAFSATNVGSSTLTTVVDKLVFTTPANASSDAMHIYSKAAPVTPYTLTAMFLPNINPQSGAATSFAGILLRESATGKLSTVNVESSATAGTFGFDVMNWTNATTFSARVATKASQYFSPVLFLRIMNDNVNLTFSYSYDGQTFVQVAQVAKASFFTTGPDEIGLGGYGFVTNAVSFTIASWSLT